MTQCLARFVAEVEVELIRPLFVASGHDSGKAHE